MYSFRWAQLQSLLSNSAWSFALKQPAPAPRENIARPKMDFRVVFSLEYRMGLSTKLVIFIIPKKSRLNNIICFAHLFIQYFVDAIFQYPTKTLIYILHMHKDPKETIHKEILSSYCQVCFVPFNRLTPKKLDEGEQICYCVKCKCRVHKGCYDLEVNSSFIKQGLREFVCQRCQDGGLGDKGCIVCHRKDGALKRIGGNQVIHVFCGLMHNDIVTTSYYPEITFKKGQNYKEVRNACGLCSKPNATDQCAMQSCFKKYHGYCIWTNFKNKQIQEQDPQCEKYYFSCGDNGHFDLANQPMQKNWVYDEFDKVLMGFEEFGFRVDQKQQIKERVYQQYDKQQKQEKKNEGALRRGGFAYILCRDHESSMYCNCLNRGSGDMVQCQCCFEWYHQGCVNYQPSKTSQNYVCTYCNNFYDLKKKIIDEVKSSKTELYELKFETPKMHLNDFLWLLRVIDHRIAGGGAVKMIKQLAKYPLKTSKMELVVRSQNKKKLSILTQTFIQNYFESPQHEAILKPKQVLGLDQEQKPIILHENVEYNKKLKKYVEFIQNFVKKNNLPDSISQVIHELKFKERAIEDNYETILELSKSHGGYQEIAILKIKVQEFSFMEVIKDIDSGSMIRFEDLENAVVKAQSASANVPSYLLKPLIQRYEKVKNLVQLVSKNIHQKKESSNQTQNAVRKLKQDKIFPPQAYLNFHEEKKFINELYLLYLKQQGKILEQSVDTSHKIQILAKEPPCKINREIADCVNGFVLEKEYVYERIGVILEKYSRVCVIFQLKDCLKKKFIKLSALEVLYAKYVRFCQEDQDVQVSGLIAAWRNIREAWIKTKNSIEETIAELDNITQLTAALKGIEEVFENLNNLPIQISSKSEEVPQLGSYIYLEQLKSWVETLAILYTQAQLKKNPMTISKLPEGLPKQNSLVKQYHSLKKQQNQLLHKYNFIYTRISQKIQLLKADQKKPRNEQMKQNLQKPRMSDVNNFIEQLKTSHVSMDAQIKELTRSVNKSIEIGSRVSKFMAEEKHLESLFKEEEIDAVKREIDQLRKRVLIDAEICLENQLKQLYHAEICVRMQKMVITSNAQLDKMSKLLKFAEEEGLNHLSTYRRLKSKFQVGNQSTKEINLTKKHEQYLNSQAQKLRESDPFYSNLVFARKSLPLSIPQTLKQKNKHYEDLLVRNEYLKAKIDLILSQQPKKYELQQAKPIYLETLKHPFEIQGLNRLINEFQKAQKVLAMWKQQKQHDSSRSQVFVRYQNLIFHIEEISSLKKCIQQCQQITHNIKKMKHQALNLQSLCKIEEGLQTIELSNLSKNSKIYNKFKNQYFSFWKSLLQKFREQKTETVPFIKIKSILLDVYSTIQKNIRMGLSNEELKSITNYLEDLMIGIRGEFQSKGENIEPIYENFIDLQELKYEVSSGLNIRDQIKILNPFNDLNKFYTIDLQRTQSRNFDESQPLRRQRTETELQDPYLKESKNERSHKNIVNSNEKIESNSDQVEEWQKNQSGIVSPAQRNKAKQVILSKIKLNPELESYQNLQQQVRMIENQLFGENHNQIIEYFKLVESIERLFIKLATCPNLSAKVAKKRFQWKFLMLLIQNMKEINQIESMIAEKNKETAPQPTKQTDKKDQKYQKPKQKEGKKQLQQKKQRQMGKQLPIERPKQKQKEKQKTIEEMIASGKVDDQVRKEMKRQIKAIRDKNKKKKHKSSRRRSRSRSRSKSKSLQRSPDAKFSSDSQQNQLPPFIEKQYNEPIQRHIGDPYGMVQNTDAPLMYDPEELENDAEVTKKGFPKGTTLQIKNVDIQFSLKKKGKINIKGFMLTTQDYDKLIMELVDPGFTQIQLKRDKTEQEIIQYLNKPSRKKYKFLVGWFESSTKQQNELIRDFTIECNQRVKIFGVQNENIKMHVMTIQQFSKITQMHEPPATVTSQIAAEALKTDRLVYVIQYPSEKMYELKGIYQNFTNVVEKEGAFPVDVPEMQISGGFDRGFIQNPYLQMYNPLLIPQESIKIMDNNPLKPVEYEGWGSSQTSVSTFPGTSFQQSSYNPLNVLSRFEPILTDQEDNNNDNKPEKEKVPTKEEKQIDLASNILNSLADVTLKTTEIPPIPRSYPIETRPVEEQRFDQPYRYPMQVPAQMAQQRPVARWQQQPTMMPGQHPQMPMGRPNMPYNPMSMVQKFPPVQAPPSIMYKNPMMPSNPFPYQHQQGQQKPQGSQQPQQSQYDPYMYQRQ